MVKHMSYSRIIFMGLMFCSCVTDVIFAQSSVQPTVRTPLTVTPEVYSFKQDVFRPISYYTGQANVSVPLYTIETNEISFPIELRYIGGEGLRPLNTYSAVGHGWRLSAGGAITRTVNGVPDESEYYTSSSHLFPDGFFSLPASSITNEYVRNNVNTFFNSEGGFTPYYEYSPDIFTFSFLGYSGYFVMGYDKEFKIVSENIVKVEKGTGVSSSVLYQYSPVSFTLTANDGTKFYFGNQTGSTEISGGNETPAVTEAWYLTKIEFSNGNIINLIYHPNILETEKLLHMKSRYDPENYCTRPVIIKEIVLNNGNVSFISSVKTHTISNTDDYLRLIDRIEVKNNNSNLVSSIDFNYRSKAFDRYHMLYSVKIDNKLYSFIYHNEGLLPAYTPNSSIGTDYWGYYNGQNERYPNYTTMTFTKDMYLNDDNTVYHEKEPSLEHTKAGVLQSIIYPTGAHEEFEYELHTYYRYYANSLNGPYMKSESQYAQAGGLRIKKIITDNITRTFEYGSNGILYKKPVVAYWTATALNELSIEGEPHVTYSSVTERRSDGSSTAYDMNSHLDINDGSNATMSNFYDGLSSQSSLFSYHPVPAFINAFGKASSRSLERGQIKKISVYDSSSNLIKSTTYSYSRNPDRYLQYVAAIKIFTAADKYIQPFVMELAKEYGYADLMFTFHHSYCIYTFPVHLEKKITTYYSGNNTTTQTVTYYHNEQKLLSKTTTHNSAGDSLYTTF
ncbi:MAG: hypothetical protein LBV26_00410, partial [Bacteroidales bacterium]|nr:hypothetical protein [Bacteroidales bacterium]